MPDSAPPTPDAPPEADEDKAALEIGLNDAGPLQLGDRVEDEADPSDQNKPQAPVNSTDATPLEQGQ